jgi:hypothetical protein
MRTNSASLNFLMLEISMLYAVIFPLRWGPPHAHRHSPMRTAALARQMRRLELRSRLWARRAARRFLLGDNFMPNQPSEPNKADAPYRSGPVWLKSKNPASEAVRRELEEEWR